VQQQQLIADAARETAEIRLQRMADAATVTRKKKYEGRVEKTSAAAKGAGPSR